MYTTGIMKTKNLPLIVGIAMPVVFILIISLVVFTPSLFVKPQHNFIYTASDNYPAYGYDRYKNTYKIENNHLTLVPVILNTNETVHGDMPTLYMYDVKTDTTHLLSFDEAKKLSLDPGPSSPDGYTVSYKYGNNGIFNLFGSNGNDSGYFISKDKGSKRLKGLTDTRYYGSNNFQIIGWIK